MKRLILDQKQVIYRDPATNTGQEHRTGGNSASRTERVWWPNGSKALKWELKHWKQKGWAMLTSWTRWDTWMRGKAWQCQKLKIDGHIGRCCVNLKKTWCHSLQGNIHCTIQFSLWKHVGIHMRPNISELFLKRVRVFSKQTLWSLTYCRLCPTPATWCHQSPHQLSGWRIPWHSRQPERTYFLIVSLFTVSDRICGHLSLKLHFFLLHGRLWCHRISSAGEEESWLTEKKRSGMWCEILHWRLT